MTKIWFLGSVINDMILSEMQQNSFYLHIYLKMLAKIYTLENEIKTTIIIEINKIGTVNVPTNVFIFA